MRSSSVDWASVIANSARSSGARHHFALALAAASAAFGSILSLLLSAGGVWLSKTGSRHASASSDGTCAAAAGTGATAARAAARVNDDRQSTCILKGLRSRDRACLRGRRQIGEPLHDAADDRVGGRRAGGEADAQ